MKYLDRFHPNGYYHIFNHAVGSENLFRTPENFDYFLIGFEKYLSPVCKTICYCLMPNHFHFLVQIRDEESILKSAKKDSDITFDYHKFVMQQLSNFLNSYAKSYNKRFLRRGALFLDYTKRIIIEDNNSLMQVTKYIHLNPVRHGFCTSINDWSYSSYARILDLTEKSLERDLIFEYFDGVDHFIDFHKNI